MACWLAIVGAVSSHSAISVPVEQDAADRDYQHELPHIDPTEPSDVGNTFRVDPNFRLELAACEPLVTDPVAAAFDEFGRLYVVEMRDYSEDDQLHLGRVVRLEDRDQDGRYDVSTVFADGLSWPTAIACWKGGVIVAQAPDIVYHTDHDHDGKADQHTTVFQGFGRDNVQGMINSFRWGPDNRLYGSSSTNGGEIANRLVTVPDLQLRRRDFRLDPRTWTMEPVTGGGQHGLSFDRWGERYVCSNSDHLQWIAYEQSELEAHPRLGRQPAVKSIAADGPAAEVFRISQVEPWRLVRTRLRLKGIVPGLVEGGGRAAGYFTGATGVTIYQGDAYPEPFQSGTFAFVGDVGGNLIHCKEIRQENWEPRGYRIHEGSEFLASTDVWFRPVQMELGPDGNLYVLDMYREVIEHPASLPPVIKQHLDLTRGRDRGRIYRIVAQKPVAGNHELPGDLPPRQLIPLVAHTNAWQRDTAARLILEQPRPEFIEPLRDMVRSAENPLGRARALSLLIDLSALRDDDLLAALRDSDPRVRRHAIRHIRRFRDADRRNEALQQLSTDTNWHVLRELVLALDLLPAPSRQEIWVRLAQQAPSADRIRVALLDGVDVNPAEVLPPLLTQSPPSDRHEQGAADRHATWSRMVHALLAQLGSSRAATPIVTILSQIENLELADRAAKIDLLLAIALPIPEMVALLQRGGQADADTYLQSIVAQARQTANDAHASLPLREQAIAFLGQTAAESSDDFWRPLLAANQPTQIRTAAITAIPQAIPDLRAANLLLHALSQLLPHERQMACDLLLARPASIPAIFTHIQDGIVQPQDLPLSHRDRLVRHDVESIRTAAQQLFAAPSNRQEAYQRYQQVLRMEGNVLQGEQVFRRACATCHRVGDQGANVGPELTAARRKGAEFLLTNIMDPNREVDPRYEGYALETKDGRILAGIITEQSSTTVTLRRAEGMEDRVPLHEIESLRSTGRSLMPEGLEADINLEQMANLLAYLTNDAVTTNEASHDVTREP